MYTHGGSRGIFCPMPGAPPPPVSKRSMLSEKSIVSHASIVSEHEVEDRFPSEEDERGENSFHMDHDHNDLDLSHHMDRESNIPESLNHGTSSKPELVRRSSSRSVDDSQEQKPCKSSTVPSSSIQNYKNKYEMAIKNRKDLQGASVESSSSESRNTNRGDTAINRSGSFPPKMTMADKPEPTRTYSTDSGESEPRRKYSSDSDGSETTNRFRNTNRGEIAPNRSGSFPPKMTSADKPEPTRTYSTDSGESEPRRTYSSDSDRPETNQKYSTESSRPHHSRKHSTDSSKNSLEHKQSGPYRKYSVEPRMIHLSAGTSSSSKDNKNNNKGEERTVGNESDNDPEMEPRSKHYTGQIRGIEKGSITQEHRFSSGSKELVSQVASRTSDANREIRQVHSEDESSFSRGSQKSSTGGSVNPTRTSGIASKEIGLVEERSGKKRASLLSCQSNNSSSCKTHTIALLGASGMTGGRFLHSALDAGYRVKCVPSDDPRQTSVKNQPWKILQAEMEDTQQLEILVSGVNYVVVMINDLLPRKSGDYPALFLTRLVGKLYALMRREDSMQVFFLQATSLAANVEGRTPMLSKVVKTTTRRRDPFMRDLDTAIKKIAAEHCLRPRTGSNVENQDPNPTLPQFSFLVTRPTILLQNGPGCKRLFASKSQPGPVPISHVDLAEFSLNALTTTKLYNSSPYVVADCF